MSVVKVFGRITADRQDCIDIANVCFDKCLMCYEKADDGCSADHCHFLGETSTMKNLRSLRAKIADLTKNATGQSHQYSVKPYDPDLDAEAYICKGHKKDALIVPEILINTYNEDVDSSRNRFHATAGEIRADKHNKPIWRELVSYIQKTNPLYIAEILKIHKVKKTNHLRIKEVKETVLPSVLEETALMLYDMMVKQDKAMPNPYLAKQAVLSALSRLAPPEIAPDIRKIIARSFIPNDILFS